MSDEVKNATGGCYCGKIRYVAASTSAKLVECHCSQCRKQSGHRYATTVTRASEVQISGEDSLSWFRASPAAQRAFCSSCGSHLFWRSLEDDSMALLAASLDEPDAFHLGGHIFVQDKGSYYEIDDGLPQFIGYDTPIG